MLIVISGMPQFCTGDDGSWFLRRMGSGTNRHRHRDTHHRLITSTSVIGMLTFAFQSDYEKSHGNWVVSPKSAGSGLISIGALKIVMPFLFPCRWHAGVIDVFICLIQFIREVQNCWLQVITGKMRPSDANFAPRIIVVIFWSRET